MTDAFLLGNAAMYLDSTAIPALVRDPTKSKVAGKVGYGLHPKAVKVLYGNRRFWNCHFRQFLQERGCLPSSPMADVKSIGPEDCPFGRHA